MKYERFKRNEMNHGTVYSEPDFRWPMGQLQEVILDPEPQNGKIQESARESEGEYGR
jgi:hypothetical protein